MSGMRAMVLHAPGDLRLEERPVPKPGRGEVLVRVRSVGICGSDLHMFEEGRVGTSVVTAPVVLGHEFGGAVAGVGEGVDPALVGVRVAVEPQVPCRRCRPCRTGHPNLCTDVHFLGDPPVDGALRDYLVVPQEMAHPIPAALSDDAAALHEPLGVAIWATGKGRVAPGRRVLVTGAGPVGLLVVQLCRARGATEVLVTDPNEARLQLAERYGATAHRGGLDGLPAPPPDVVVECTGIPEVVADAIRAAGRAADVVLVGMGARDPVLPLAHVQSRELTLHGVFRYAETWPTARDLAVAGTVDLDGLVTHRFGLERTAAAFACVREDASTVVKAVIDLTEAGTATEPTRSRS